jgi:hypothetical protein
MSPRSHFENLEIMSRERATLAKKEAEYRLAEADYRLAEADEWRQIAKSRIANCSSDLANSNNDQI